MTWLGISTYCLFEAPDLIQPQPILSQNWSLLSTCLSSCLGWRNWTLSLLTWNTGSGATISCPSLLFRTHPQQVLCQNYLNLLSHGELGTIWTIKYTPSILSLTLDTPETPGTVDGAGLLTGIAWYLPWWMLPLATESPIQIRMVNMLGPTVTNVKARNTYSFSAMVKYPTVLHFMSSGSIGPYFIRIISHLIGQFPKLRKLIPLVVFRNFFKVLRQLLEWVLTEIGHRSTSSPT